MRKLTAEVEVRVTEGRAGVCLDLCLPTFTATVKRLKQKIIMDMKHSAVSEFCVD